MRKNILIGLLLLSSEVQAVELQIGDRTYVAESGINLREKPDSNSAKLTLVKEFEEIQILEIAKEQVKVKKWTGRWAKIKTSTHEGYVLDSFLMEPAESIESVLIKDTYWEIGSRMHQIGARKTSDRDAAQGNLSFWNQNGEMVSTGTGEGSTYCYYDRIFSRGKNILIHCQKSGEKPDHGMEGEKQNTFVKLEKINRKTLKIVNFAHRP